MRERRICRGYIAMYHDDKLPRKLKKIILGTKITRKELRDRLAKVYIKEHNKQNGYIELSDYFCPKCGCEITRTINHHVEYPEIWTENFCVRCNEYVGGQDNSWPHHILIDYIYERDNLF